MEQEIDSNQQIDKKMNGIFNKLAMRITRERKISAKLICEKHVKCHQHIVRLSFVLQASSR